MLYGPHHEDLILMGSMQPKIRVAHGAGCQGCSSGLLNRLQNDHDYDEMRASFPWATSIWIHACWI